MSTSAQQRAATAILSFTSKVRSLRLYWATLSTTHSSFFFFIQKPPWQKMQAEESISGSWASQTRLPDWFQSKQNHKPSSAVTYCWRGVIYFDIIFNHQIDYFLCKVPRAALLQHSLVTFKFGLSSDKLKQLRGKHTQVVTSMYQSVTCARGQKGKAHLTWDPLLRSVLSMRRSRSYKT